ncbi:rhomboid family intramembrane serine protease [Jatrophihabitans fulvus]
MTAARRSFLRPGAGASASPGTRPAPQGWRYWVSPGTWPGAFVLMVLFAGVLWAIQAVNAVHPLIEYGLRPRDAVGLRGVVTEPFLHGSWDHLASNTLPLVLIGWVVLLAGVREWLVVSGVVVVVGGLLTWLIAPGNQVIVGASGLVFGWLGYLIARAVFSRAFRWIVSAGIVMLVFGTLLFGLLPTQPGVSWQAHVCGFAAGILVAALLYDPRGGPGALARRP